jgi:hypothetical protein
VELPPPIREFQSNMIVLAIWIAKQKPDVNIFLKETISNLFSFIHDGISIVIENQKYDVDLATQFFISDLPAKALFCRTTYFNGYSACTCCHARGNSIW